MRFVSEIAQDLVQEFFAALCAGDIQGASVLLADSCPYCHWDGSSFGKDAFLQACATGRIRWNGVELLDVVVSAKRNRARSEVRMRVSGRFFGETFDSLEMRMRCSFERDEMRRWRIARIESLRASGRLEALPQEGGERAEYALALWGSTRFEGLFSGFADASASLAQVLFAHDASNQGSSSEALDRVSREDAPAVLEALDRAARESLHAPSEADSLVSMALQESGLASAESPAPVRPPASGERSAPQAPKLSAQQRSFIDSALREVGQAIGADAPDAAQTALSRSQGNPAFASAEDDAVSQALAAALAAETFGDDESGITQSSGGFLLL